MRTGTPRAATPRPPPATTGPGPARPRALVRVALLLAGAALLTPTVPLLANGGTLRVADAAVGGYRVSVYTDPTPPRPDSVDVSILVLRPEELEPVDGLDVTLAARLLEAAGGTDAGAAAGTGTVGGGEESSRPGTAAGAGPDGDPLVFRATRDQADDPRYYAAKFSPGTAGRWRFTVAVRGPEGDGGVSFEVTVREPGFFERPAVVLVLALVPLLLLGGWLLRASGGGKGPDGAPSGDVGARPAGG